MFSVGVVRVGAQHGEVLQVALQVQRLTSVKARRHLGVVSPSAGRSSVVRLPAVRRHVLHRPRPRVTGLRLPRAILSYLQNTYSGKLHTEPVVEEWARVFPATPSCGQPWFRAEELSLGGWGRKLRAALPTRTYHWGSTPGRYSDTDIPTTAVQTDVLMRRARERRTERADSPPRSPNVSSQQESAQQHHN